METTLWILLSVEYLNILFSSIKQTAQSNILVYYIPENLKILTG